MSNVPIRIKRSSKWRYRAGKAANRLSHNRLQQMTGSRHPRIVDRTIHCPNWPEAHDGFRIAHLSDFHIGELLTIDDALRFLDEFHDRLDSPIDLVAVTGDILDFKTIDCLPLLQRLSGFPSVFGTYAVLGNHDILVDRGSFIEMCASAGLNLLVDERIHLDIEGRAIELIGIDWARKQTDLAGHVRKAMVVNNDSANQSPTNQEAARILLAHHPSVFRAAAARHAHLVLSGHTHGGQLNLLQPTINRSAIGLGTLAHRYSWGIYESGVSRLHVTSGIGSWFPFRVNCPSEIAVLTVRRSCEPNRNL